jgi:hypothetical protein
MIEKLYGKYFQKSKSFLYPALGIKKLSYISFNTYLSIEGLIPVEDMQLICHFKNTDNEKFKNFEDQNILTNPLYVKTVELEGENYYIFDLDIYRNDWVNFMLGKYSKMSNVIKKAIRTYYGDKSPEYSYMDTYLNPEEYYEKYSKLLEIDVDTLKRIGELCDPCDLEKETLKSFKKNLQVEEKII